MPEVNAGEPPRPAVRPLAAISTVAGALLFIYTLQAAGPAEILRQLRQIGLGFVAVLALSALRMAVRAKAWSLCAEEAFSFSHAVRAFVTGDAVGNITPLGPLASESTKALLSRHTLSTSSAFSSVLLENIFYGISVAIMVTIGTLAFLLGYRPTDAALAVSLGLGGMAIASVLAVWWILSRQPRLIGRVLAHTAVRDAEDRVFRFATAHRRRVGQILLLEFAFHAAAVLEIACLLTILVGFTAHTLLNALILGTAERLITIVFKFVPLRLGVDHIGAGSVAGLLGLGQATGITIATVRTARNLFWATLGITLLWRRSSDR